MQQVNTKTLLQSVPDKYKLDYLRTYKRLMQIRQELTGFYPTNENQLEKLRVLLKEYHVCFNKKTKIEDAIKNG
jgi:hypothetical protein